MENASGKAVANHPDASPSSRAYTYFAFISYKSQDIKWARWLKRQLQLYRLPAKTRKSHPDVVQKCSPIFLDKMGLRPGELDKRLRDEVQASKFLIVICSKNACANSTYLDAELDFFLEGGGDISRVLPIIVDKSADPVNECFPKRLRELSEHETIVAANVHDDGRRSALIKLVATMLELRVEELEGDDARRQKRRKVMAGIAAAALVACAFAAWNYLRVKTRYYLDYTEVRGVPQGIYPLSESELASLNRHYAIDSSRGAVRELRCENSAGVVVEDTRIDRVDRPVKAVYEYRERGRLDRVTWQDEHGKRFAYDEMGRVSHVSYLSYVDGAYEVVGNKDGVAGLLLAYDDAGDLARADLVDRDGKPTPGEEGVCSWRMSYDDHNMVRSTCLDADGKRVSNKAGFASLVTAYDEQAHVAQESYLDVYGKLVLVEDGYATVTYERDAQGRVAKVTYCDTNGKPTLIEGGYASATFTYDAYGNMTSETHYDAGGKPVLIEDGYATIAGEYNAQGKLTKLGFYGTDGKPILIYGGYASIVFEYDASGNMTSVGFCDDHDEPVVIAGGYASLRRAYDSAGNLARESYVDASGQPTIIEGGYAAVVIEHDSRGNVTTERFVDVGDRPVMSEDGYATITYEYDSRGKLVGMRRLDAEGNVC